MCCISIAHYKIIPIYTNYYYYYEQEMTQDTGTNISPTVKIWKLNKTTAKFPPKI